MGRGFVLVYRSGAERQEAEEKRLEAELSNSLKVQETRTKDLQATKLKAKSIHQELYQLQSKLSTLETAQKNAKAKAAAANLEKANAAVQAQEVQAQLTKAMLSQKEAEEKIELAKLKAEADEASKQAQAAAVPGGNSNMESY